jgi:hypothetical protein
MECLTPGSRSVDEAAYMIMYYSNELTYKLNTQVFRESALGPVLTINDYYAIYKYPSLLAYVVRKLK